MNICYFSLLYVTMKHKCETAWSCLRAQEAQILAFKANSTLSSTISDSWLSAPIYPNMWNHTLCWQYRLQYTCMCARSLQSHPTLCGYMDCSLPGSSVHGMSRARILEWVAISSSRGSSWARGQACISCLAGRFFATESAGKPPNIT